MEAGHDSMSHCSTAWSPVPEEANVQLSLALPESRGGREEVVAAPDRAGASAGALRLPVLAAGLSTVLTGGWGVARSGSSSGSLPVTSVSGVVVSRERVAAVRTHPAARRGSAESQQCTAMRVGSAAEASRKVFWALAGP